MEWITKEQYLPSLDKDIDYSRHGIGLIGCGSIANQAHLPAYKKLGLQVAACCDVDAEAARKTAEAFDIPFWTTDIRELLQRREVTILDMAVHPKARMALLEQIAKAPRPVLCQKPLDVDLRQARKLGEFAREHGIVMGLNQQARWAPAHRALRLLLDQGLTGDIYAIQHTMRAFQDQEGWWWTRMEDFNIVDHGIHYLDLCRYFAQSPSSPALEWERLHCATAMQPGQQSISPLIYAVNIEYGEVGGRSPLMAALQFNNIVRAGNAHSYTWWIDGKDGSIWGDQERLYVAMTKAPSTVHEIRIKGKWFPDGFAGSMAAFIAAVDRGEAPPVPVDDHYNTIALTTAMTRSSKEGRVVERIAVLQEATGGEQAAAAGEGGQP
ncbi:Gfo/Idh/MocA family oxidoreductase [Paenibacillus sp. IB182496]|uniref:Gfo/Idh/MocA family oxidoreductase n=1 Tax=Paenibacillus sabuli TaxID=2772509 RepID=A0A927GTM0_9BACL|nr:Gfo/Idh/MocA family oxidoreductase [Paenibacillus sabuli]MBD2846872.1 Gfo/Idh/MocA family oxidoreductase [Paenibacillus sabuli]